MRRRRSCFVSALAFAVVCFTASGQESLKKEDPLGEWNVTKQSSDLVVWSRLRPGSRIKEFKALGQIDAPPSVVNAVLNDFEAYSKFMPYTAECRVMKRDEHSLITYQRIAPKISADRDYTLEVQSRSWSEANGPAFSQHWTPANNLGPAPRAGVVRVNVCEGGWLLQPAGPDKTRATYTIYTDSGGAVPTFIANYASEMGIRNLFAAVRKQVKDPKYRGE